MIKYTLLVGLNDKDTKKQELTKVQAKKIISNIVNLPSTISDATGIYKHLNGQVVKEKSIRIELYNDKSIDKTIKDFIKKIKIALNQESILFEKTRSNVSFL